MPRLPYLVLFTTLSFSFAASAQIVEQYNPAANACCQATAAQRLANALQDWDALSRYHADNERLKALPADPNRVVFMGDSITDGWKLDTYFPGKPYVNRGISGQVTSQMLVRMYPDVIDLKPAAMVFFAGTNDIAQNNGPVTLTMIQENVMAISELAKLHGIKVILCSIMPIADYGRVKMSPGRPPADILRVNAWLKDYAAKNGAVYCDYFGATVDAQGLLKQGISMDGLHPNADGYKLMVPVVQAAIDEALKK